MKKEIHEFIIAKRSHLIKIKKVSRSIEMTVDKHLKGGYAIQFCKDVVLYNLYEALLMCHNDELCLDILKEIN